jgi:hypothetical protein
MDADLVCPPCLEPDVEKRALTEVLAHLEPRDGVARCVGVERVTCPVTAVAADRGRDSPGARPQCAAYERGVAPLDPALPDRVREAAVRLLRAGGREKPRGVAIEAMDDARSIRVASGGAEREKPLRQRAASTLARGMDDQTGRLVHDEQVLVLVGDQ